MVWEDKYVLWGLKMREYQMCKWGFEEQKRGEIGRILAKAE